MILVAVENENREHTEADADLWIHRIHRLNQMGERRRRSSLAKGLMVAY